MSKEFIKGFHEIYEELCSRVDSESSTTREKEILEKSLTCLKNTLEEMKNKDKTGVKTIQKIIERNLL